MNKKALDLAHEAGRNAGRQNVHPDGCPFVPGPERKAWMEGYKANLEEAPQVPDIELLLKDEIKTSTKVTTR